MQKISKRDLTTGSIAKNLWFLAFPMMATNALQTLFNIVDMIFVGRLGPAPIAAVAVVGMILMIPFAFALGLGVASGAMVSRYYGAKDYHNSNYFVLQSIFTGFAGGLIMMVIGYMGAPYLINLFKVDQTVQNLGTIYLQIMFLVSIPIVLQFLTSAIFQAVGDAKTALWINVCAVFVNIILDPFLIFGIGPFPRLEVAGAAIATAIARSMGMIIALLFLTRKKTHIQIKLSHFKIDTDAIKRLLKIAMPSSLQMVIRGSSGIVLMGIVAKYGTFALAAYGIGIRIDMLVMMPGFGLGAATATLVGQNIGAQKLKRAVKSTWLSAFYYVLIMCIAGVLFYNFPHFIYSFFNKTENVLLNGKIYLETIVFSYPFIALGIIFTRALGGAGETISTMLVTAFSLFCVAVPLAFVFPHLFNTGVRGIWYALVVSNIIHALIVGYLFLHGKWKIKKI